MKTKLFLFASLLFISPLVQSATEDENVMGYDEIVKQLATSEAAQTNNASRSRLNATNDALDNVLLHGGVSLTNMFGRLSLAGDRKVYLNQKGMQANLGIDLLSPQWLAEGSVRTFTENSYGETSVVLKEFDLKLLYKPRLANSLGLRMGGGVSARYMTIRDSVLGVQSYKTPSSVGAIGFEIFFSPMVSMGLESSIRTALIEETVDRQTYDAGIRFDAHF